MKNFTHNILSHYRRNWQPGGTFFFTVNLKDRTDDLLVRQIDVLKYAVNKVKSKRPFVTHAWVVLPDHMHCIWQLPELDSDFATRVRLLKTYFTQSITNKNPDYANRNHRGEAQVWQKRYWEHTIKGNLDFERHIDYVHINPLKHGYVGRVQDWQWSSFHTYVEKGIYPVDWAGNMEELYTQDFGE